MKRLHAVQGLLLAIALVWLSLGLVHGERRLGGALLAVGVAIAAASLFLLVVGFPGILRTRSAWVITLGAWLLVVMLLFLR